ncbi:MAG: hypothetical protein ACK4J0_02125 [Candidatus Anstonellaceae archaeon]
MKQINKPNKHSKKSKEKENAFSKKLPLPILSLPSSNVVKYGLDVFFSQKTLPLLITCQTKEDFYDLIKIPILLTPGLKRDLDLVKINNNYKFVFEYNENNENTAKILTLLDQIHQELSFFSLYEIKREIGNQALFKAIDYLDVYPTQTIFFLQAALKHLEANPNTLNKDGLTPLEYLQTKNFKKPFTPQIVLIIQTKYDKDLSEEYEEFYQRKVEIIHLLKEYGALERKKP